MPWGSDELTSNIGNGYEIYGVTHTRFKIIAYFVNDFVSNINVWQDTQDSTITYCFEIVEDNVIPHLGSIIDKLLCTFIDHYNSNRR